MPALYLIPAPIADDALGTIPTKTVEHARRLEVFVAERAKTARHYLKALGLERPIQTVTVAEIPQEGGLGESKDVFLQAIRAGKDVGLLSEAGCPGVADPGAALVALAHREGVRVVPLAGPSSPLLALMASGMNGQQFAFHGYLSPKRPALAADLRRLEQTCERNKGQTQLFIETPYRSQMVLEVALETLKPHTRFAVAQDLTGPQEIIRSLPIKDWRQMPTLVLGKLPAVFLVGV